MSFEAFVQTFKDGEFHGISRQGVRDAFGQFVRDLPSEDWQVYYDELNNSDVMLTPHPTDSTLLRGFTVDRPCGDSRLWDSLAAILRLGNVVLYFPSSCPPLIADSKVAAHLPPDMIESLGQPKCVSTGREIVDALKAS